MICYSGPVSSLEHWTGRDLAQPLDGLGEERKGLRLADVPTAGLGCGGGGKA